ncbi:MAG TPA: hypothetical protein VGC97_18270 [Pyrinomonadaceae bacterium]
MPVSIQEKLGISFQAKHELSTNKFSNSNLGKLQSGEFTFWNTAASVTTDRSDYQIGDTAIITGSGFLANESVRLQVAHVSGTGELSGGHDPWFVTADSNGNISSTWYVDPDDSLGATFLLTADGQSSFLHAEHTFTDNVGVNLDQCQNVDLLHLNDPCGTTPANQHPNWANGDINGNNSQYREGDGLPYRSSFTNLPSGTWVIRVDYDFTKGGIFAVDRLTSYNLTQASNPCLSTGDVICNVGAPAFSFEMPSEVVTPGATQPTLPNAGFLDIAGTTNTVGSPNTADRNMSVWVEGGNAAFVSTGQNATINDNRVKQNGSSAADSDREFAFKFTLANCPAAGCNVMLGWTGHIASAVDWGSGKGARSISGAPFHMRVKGVDDTDGTTGSGNQDRSVQLSAIVQQTLVVNKVLVPSSDGGRFNLQIDGSTSGTGASVGDGGTTGLISVTSGSHTVGETAVNGTNLANYTTTIDCGSGELQATSTTVNVASGANAVCTITNTLRRGSVKLIKNVIGRDVETFPYAVTALGANPTVNITTAAGTGSITFSDLPSGTKTVDEGTMPAGWSFVSLTCTDPDGGTSVVGDAATIDLDPGEDIVCTFTNRFTPPKLIVIKHVINDNGGTKVAADFTMSVTATNPSPSSFPGAESPGTDVGLTAGTYSVGESALSGYAASYSADCSGSIADGETKTCTVTNNDISPTLTLVKTVVNDNGGTKAANDFPRFIDGNAVSWTVAVNVTPGSHTASETTMTGYTASAWGGDCAANGTVTLALAENKTCTITNDDISPRLKLVKTVINNNGGTKVANDFARFIDGNPVSWSVAVNVNAGNHTASETTLPGYQASNWGGDCAANGTVTLALGDYKTCTITNDDISPTLTLVKTVVNDNGGTKVANDFPRFIDGNAVSWSVAVNVNAGSHTASETTQYGYTASAWGGDCAANGTVTLALAQNKTCTITNNDQPGTIIVQKVIKPTGSSTNFSFDANGTGYNDFGLAGGQSNSQSLNAGNYSVMEMVPLGWVLTGIGGSSDVNTPYNCTITGSGGSTGVGSLATQTATISLKNGDTVTCVFENTGQGVTRTQGFWGTHTPLANIAWFGGTAFGHTFPGVAAASGIGDATLCGRPIDTLGKLMGGFWSDISKTSTGAKRSALDQARMQLLQQLLAAELNASAFGSQPSSGSFAAWESAYCGTNTNTIKNAQQQAASFNSLGDSSSFTPGTSADSKNARLVATYTFWDLLP